MASAETVDACRSLSTSESLKAFWEDARDGDASINTLVVAGGFLAIQTLQVPGADPDVDPTVSSAMAAAAVNASTMREEWVASAHLDLDAFGALITPVVKACQEAGIPMS